MFISYQNLKSLLIYLSKTPSNFEKTDSEKNHSAKSTTSHIPCAYTASPTCLLLSFNKDWSKNHLDLISNLCFLVNRGNGRSSSWFNDSVLLMLRVRVAIYINLRLNDSFLHILDQIGYTWLIMTFSDSIWYVFGETTNLITL